MATATANTSQNYWKLRLEAWEESYSAANNTSLVKWEVWLDANGGSITSRQLYKKAIVNGETVLESTGAVSVATNGTVLLGSGTKTITHDSDGSKSVNVSAQISGSGTWTHPIGQASCSLTLVLSNIPRASIPSINTWPENSPAFVIGDTITIHMNRKNSSFVHTVFMDIGDYTHTVATNIADNTQFDTSTVAQYLLAQCPTSKQCTGTITVSTYLNGTRIGTETCPYKAVVPGNLIPVISSYTAEEHNQDVYDVTGGAKYVKGESFLYLTINASHPDSNTQLDKIIVKNSAVTLTRNISGQSATEVFQINGITSNYVDVYIYDKRGKYMTQRLTWTLINYFLPVVAFTPQRVGTNLTSLRCKVTGKCWRGDFGESSNSIKIRFWYKLKGASSFVASATEQVVSSNDFEYQVTLAETFDADKSYDIRATIFDLLEQGDAANVTIPQALPIAAYHEDHFDVFGALHIHDRANPANPAILNKSTVNPLLALTAQELQMLADNVGLNIRIATGTLNTPANDGADLSATWSVPMPNATYYVGITLASNPNGFTNVGYVVSARTTAGCTIHSYNDNAYSVSQDLLVIAIGL